VTWDRRTPQQRAKQQEAAVRSQVVDAVGPFSPWWRDRLKALGRTAASVATVDAVRALPAVGERDVCPDGDPAGAAALVLQATEAGYALHAEGPQLRKALAARLAVPGSYRAVVEGDTRPTSYVWAGLGVRFPVASTRRDLDVVARAGARAWQVLGLTPADVLVSALPLLPTAASQALQLAATGAGVPALHVGDDPDDVAEALRLVPATVLAVPAATAERAVDDLDEAGAPLATVTTLLLVGAPTDDERAGALDALSRAGARGAVALALHVPDGHRLPWAECRQGGAAAGLHTHPDLELVDGVDPDTGEGAPSSGPVEVVVTQLGLRGTALLRWRTGDVAQSVVDAACPGCGRTVPRVLGVRRGALVPRLALRRGPQPVDLRSVTGALAGADGVADWRVVVQGSPRDGSDQLLVHVVPAAGADEADVAVAVARDVRAAAGLLPTQVVVDSALPSGEPLTPRVLIA
jgi:phenylacetate-coenzyme A ligase PaaK-like adenylate-forming protein